MSEAGGGDLFIVDNSVSGWTGLEYLSQWSDLARSFDIATGFFEIGALLALDGKWQQLEKIRLLMGDEVSLRTHSVFKKALSERVGRLDGSLEREKLTNPFLEGVDPRALSARLLQKQPAASVGHDSCMRSTGTDSTCAECPRWRLVRNRPHAWPGVPTHE